MHIINARLRNREGLHDLHLEHGRIASITAQTTVPALQTDDLDAAGNLVIPPFVEPHIHLDATLTAGEPRWNMSGTLFEGIECWGERKATITFADTKARATQTIQALAAHGFMQHAAPTFPPAQITHHFVQEQVGIFSHCSHSSRV